MKSLKILIASGAFKDVFSPMGACKMIQGILETIQDNLKLEVMNSVPMVDGGEYSSEVLLTYPGVEKISVKGTVNPMGELIDGYYLKLDSNTAYISSSSILKLSPESEEYKNPLNLTTYGYGQLIKHAVDNGFKKIILSMGGTSTVDGGIGMAQALGLNFQFDGDVKRDYLKGEDMIKISGIEKNELGEKYGQVEVMVLCDGCATIAHMHATAQKVGDFFGERREEIVKNLNKGVMSYSNIISTYLKTNKIKRKALYETNNIKMGAPHETNKIKRRVSYESLDNEPYFGTAGGIMLSLIALFDINPSLGVDFFCKRFNLSSQIQKSDLVITGEGKFDNSFEGKTPVGVSRLAKQFNKPVLYLVGDIGSQYKNIRKQFTSYLSNNLPNEFSENGITAMISCHPFFDKNDVPKEYKKRISFFKEHTPPILSEGLNMYFRCFEGGRLEQ